MALVPLLRIFEVFVIAPAEKFPLESRATIALAVFAEAAVVAEFETFPEAVSVGTSPSTIVRKVGAAAPPLDGPAKIKFAF